MQIHAGEAESGRDQRPGLLAVGTKGFAVFVQFRIEAAGPPAGENLFHGRDVNPQEVGERLEVGRKRHDRADVEIAVSPAVKSLADSRSERAVDGRVAQGTLDAHRLDAAV